jgi:Arc/MetJ-type ribon-helix-helix transcriptional regulator
MHIEIHQPELEQRVREQIQSGHFHDVDDLLSQALDALREKQEISKAGPALRERATGAVLLAVLAGITVSRN